ERGGAAAAGGWGQGGAGKASATIVAQSVTGGAPASQRRLAPWRPRLDAHLRVRKDLVRIRTLLGIEDGTQPDHREEVVRREEQRHLADLLDADAVLAGDAAAERDAGLENLA